MLSGTENRTDAPRTSRKILILGGPALDLTKELHPHKMLRTPTLEGSFEMLEENRPDVIVHFVHKADEPLEETILAWMIGGFRGNLVVFDPQNRLKDSHSLTSGHLIDAYVAGPVSPTRFTAMIKSHLNPVGRGGASRSYAVFDLFRHLFERSMDAIFFFSEDLERCLAANKQAEKLTGRTLFELRRTGLAELCAKGHFAEVEKVVQKARHSYYDAHGQSELKDRLGRPLLAQYNIGTFHFGRRSFIKFEIQSVNPASAAAESKAKPKLSRLSYRRRREDQGSWDAGLERGVSLLVCRVHLPENAEDEDRLLEVAADRIRATIRKTDSLARLSRAQFAILLPKTTEENVALARKRLQSALAHSLPKGCRLDFESAHCPPEAYPFLQLLENAAREAPERKHAFG